MVCQGMSDLNSTEFWDGKLKVMSEYKWNIKQGDLDVKRFSLVTLITQGDVENFCAENFYPVFLSVFNLLLLGISEGSGGYLHWLLIFNVLSISVESLLNIVIVECSLGYWLIGIAWEHHYLCFVHDDIGCIHVFLLGFCFVLMLGWTVQVLEHQWQHPAFS